MFNHTADPKAPFFSEGTEVNRRQLDRRSESKTGAGAGGSDFSPPWTSKTSPGKRGGLEPPAGGAATDDSPPSQLVALVDEVRLGDGVRLEEGVGVAGGEGEGEGDARGGGGDGFEHEPTDPAAIATAVAEAMLANRRQQRQCSGTNGAAGAPAGPWCGVVRSLTPRAVEASAKASGVKNIAAAAASTTAAAAIAAVASSSLSSSTAAAADAAVGGGGGCGDRAGRRLLSRHDNADNEFYDDDDDNTTRMGSFRFPETSGSYERRGGEGGALAGPGDGRAGPRNGRHAIDNGTIGDGDADAGIEDDDDDDGGWEADSEAALTAAETPAAALAPVFEMERAERGGSGPGGNGARTMEPKGDSRGGEGGGAAAGGLLERRGSMLDAYREPEGHDWGELEDWQGFPGLQATGIVGSGGGADIRSRLQVSFFFSCFLGWWWWWRGEC